ncbi:MAG: glycosyltransferase family 4 protein [Calditrichia bacterium]
MSSIDNRKTSIKVLITGPSFEESGGVANYLSILTPKLGDNITYFVLGSREGSRKGSTQIQRFLMDYVRYVKILRNDSIDLVHSNPSLNPAGLIRDSIFILLAYLYKKKTFVFFHGWHVDFAKKCGHFPWRLFLKFLLKADASAVLANEFKQVLKSWDYERPVYLETTFVDKDLFAFIEQSKNDNNNSTKQKKPVILFLSRLERKKGIFETIETCRILKRSYPDLQLIVAGNGSVEKEVRDFCAGITWIQFPGYISGVDKYRVYQRADLYLFPTYYPEGMPTSVLEAMAAGLPVVTRPVAGLADFFDAGKMGALTDSLEPKVLAGECDRLLSSPTKMVEVGHYNSDYARKHFLAENVAKRLRKIYKEVAKINENASLQEANK